MHKMDRWPIDCADFDHAQGVQERQYEVVERQLEWQN